MKIDVPLKYVHIVEVDFSGAFPIDMLRYDRCIPYRETDSHVIEESHSFNPKANDYFTHKVVHLFKYSYFKTFEESFTPDRWQSFGCTIKEINHE